MWPLIGGPNVADAALCIRLDFYGRQGHELVYLWLIGIGKWLRTEQHALFGVALDGRCITSRHTRRNAQGELVTFTNQELARNSQPDELKGLGMMMQQLLQGMQIQGKALNQVSTYINIRMDNMFTELNTKYDIVSNHIKRIDVQLAQTAESVKRQQGMFPGKSAMNPRVEHCNATELRCEKAEGKEPEQLSAETASGEQSSLLALKAAGWVYEEGKNAS
ncbi:hypothetical protein F2Q69_00044355 [Brassica cretica]|uniref:Uncharacterized protein n=1 Tax=Brassica cretica TaxID=69181 RepID=A0A8S9N6B2_BRACR|nr:hypothetical protein F2Q69_00044355 [Brassica cretica]